MTFSILERIDVGETFHYLGDGKEDSLAFSILERIDVGETTKAFFLPNLLRLLSVSSNGSTWVKPIRRIRWRAQTQPFSILERIDVGETEFQRRGAPHFHLAFSILERIDVGETRGLRRLDR